MSALGQKQTSEDVQGMSALLPKADIHRSRWEFRFVPKADIGFTTMLDDESKIV